MNPANKQYFTFALILSAILSFIINFGFVELIKGTFLYGFPINLGDSEGFLNFLFRIINTLVVGLFLAIPVFYILKEMYRKK